MSAAKKTTDKRKLSEYERIRDLDARAVAWAKERGVPITAVTWREMHMEALQRERNRILSMQVEVIERAPKLKDDEERERTWREMMEGKR